MDRDRLFNLLGGALAACRLILLGSLPAVAARWVGLLVTIAQTTIPVVHRFTDDEFRDMPGDRKGRAVVVTLRKALDELDDAAWNSLSEARKDALLDAVKEIALFIIDATTGQLDRKASKRATGPALKIDVHGLAELAVNVARLDSPRLASSPVVLPKGTIDRDDS